VYVSWGTPAPDQVASLREIDSAGEVHVYENPDALPRAYVAHAVEVVPDDKAALHVLRDKEFDPTQQVVIEGPLPVLALSGDRISPAPVRQRSPQDVIVDTESSQDGVLVLTDSNYPGWRAFVDGREEPILHANYLFRGVPIRAGKHTIEFIYTDDSFKAGLLISGVTLALILPPAAGWTRRREKWARSRQYANRLVS
jgi:hypothetical protein